MKMTNRFTRREFLQTGATAAMASSIGVGKSSAEKAEVGGSRHESEVPDTLDLAERAALSVNALTGAADPEHDFETYLTAHLDQRPPYMKYLWANEVCLQKPIQALPMMRVMSGSTLRTAYDLKMVEYCTRSIDDQGLWWLNTKGGPWRPETMKEGEFWPVTQGRLMVALLDWHKYDGDPRWLEIVARLSGGLAKIALRQGDRAWYHTAFTRDGWRQTYFPSEATTGAAGQPLKVLEPQTEVFYNIGLPLHGFARWYAVSGDKQALEVAQQLARFMLKPAMWGTEEGPTMVAAAERALWSGHFHTHTMGMMGLLEYAIATNDAGLKEFVANFYEWGRNFGIARIGFFPSVIDPLQTIRKSVASNGGPGAAGQCDEGCAVADMTWLAATLSKAGVGDYWDDVDQYVRNHLVEHQVLRRDLLEEIIATGPAHKTDPHTETDKDVIERNIGSFLSGSDPTMSYAWWTMCCNANCPVGLYKAWSSMLSYRDGIAQVNLLLNRASPWLDVDSYLPYEGKVVLKNKTARKAFVRIPRWAEKKAVRCRVNQKPLVSRWLNNYLMVEGLAPQDVVTIEFPVVETVEKHTELTYGQEYTCRFKGNTLVDISPRAERPSWTQMGSDDGAMFPIRKGYPLYQRDFYKRDKAPMKKVQRYVSAVLI
jgi:hypothetical protein